jgi:hypothetical protein
MNKKLNSFTLSEMLVVLVITAIVVGLAFSVLSLVRKQVYRLQSDTDKRVEIDLLKNKLFLDFNKYPIVSLVNEDSFVCKSVLDSINYNFNNNLIIHDSDTIMSGVSEIKFFHKNIEVVKGDIDAIRLMVEERKGIIKTIFVYKHNDATDVNDIRLNGF